MSTYVMSDLHGCYNEFKEMLAKIHFSDEDMLYILGDILDKGPNPIKIALDIMKRPNVVCLAGNHEQMALECMHYLLKEITEDNIEQLGDDFAGKLFDWSMNGSETTLEEIHQLDNATRKEVVSYISDMDVYEEVHVNDNVYILVHAGLGNFDPERPIWDYELEELVWTRPDYAKAYYDDQYVITGHTPTLLIDGNPHPGYIYQANNHIAIDCGAGYGGRLGCICLETMEEYYVPCQDSCKES